MTNEENEVNNLEPIFTALEDSAVYNIVASGGILASGTYFDEVIYETYGGLLVGGFTENTFQADNIASGGLIASSTEVVAATYDLEGFGGILLGETSPHDIYKDLETSGGITVGGLAIETLGDLIEISGGITVSGSASISQNIALFLGGFADITTILNPEAQGGVVLNSGSTTLYDHEGNGGITLSGLADNYVDFDLSGGIVLAGESENFVERSILIDSVGLIVNGNSDYFTAFEATPESGVLLGGAWDSEVYVSIGEGSILASGYADNDHTQEEYNAIGITISGESIIDVQYFAESVIDSSGVSLGGMSQIAISIVAEGGALVTGEVNELKTTIELPSGGILGSGISFIKLTYLDFTASGGIRVIGKSRSENLRPLFSNRSSFSRAMGTPNVLNAEPVNPNKLIDPVGAVSPELEPQSLRGIPQPSYCEFEDACVDNWPKIPKVVLRRLGKYAPKKKTDSKPRDLQTTL